MDIDHSRLCAAIEKVIKQIEAGAVAEALTEFRSLHHNRNMLWSPGAGGLSYG
jgi:hypothetical protein